MIATMDMLEEALGSIVLPEDYWWLRDEAIVHVVIERRPDDPSAIPDRIRWVAYLAETREDEPIVATIDVRVGAVASEREMEMKLEERVAQAIRDLEEFRRKLDAKADDAGRA